MKTHLRCNSDDIRRAATGRELEILTAVAGIDDKLLDGKGHPCPWCGGNDRFSAQRKNPGAVFCRKCFATKNGDYFAAVMKAKGCGFKEALAMIGDYLQVTPQPTTRPKPPPKPRVFKSAAEAVKALESKLGKREKSWTYTDAMGEPIGVIVRWKTPAGKTIRPVSRHGSDWQIGGMPNPFPLYRLPAIATAQTVIVCEGEKAADSAVRRGFCATTSPHGSKSAAKADWSPLAGKRVIILPDNDQPGEEYAREVALILIGLIPAVEVKIVRLPGLPDSGDIADWKGDLTEAIR